MKSSHEKERNPNMKLNKYIDHTLLKQDATEKNGEFRRVGNEIVGGCGRVAQRAVKRGHCSGSAVLLSDYSRISWRVYS